MAIFEFSTFIEVEDEDTEEKTIKKAYDEFVKALNEDGANLFSMFDEDGDGV